MKNEEAQTELPGHFYTIQQRFRQEPDIPPPLNLRRFYKIPLDLPDPQNYAVFRSGKALSTFRNFSSAIFFRAKTQRL